jgi:hypothetical protein
MRSARDPVQATRRPRRAAAVPSDAVLRVVRWYFSTVYGQTEGPGVIPFYCDPSKVGPFAVQPEELVSQSEPALFRLFVGGAMFQARRDVVIMRQQRTMGRPGVQALAAARSIERAVIALRCPKLSSAEAFDGGCDVRKRAGEVDCRFRPGAACHVKDATVALNRTGDMGKLPTSAWLHFWHRTRLRSVVAEAIREDARPSARAAIIVERLSSVHRVGRKLATMFVGALSTPALAPGLTPWYPAVDGNELVVVDTNVAQAIHRLDGGRVARTYDACARWVRGHAARIDLTSIRADVPRYSPRLIQQALYRFCSESNRRGGGDPCSEGGGPCSRCVPTICPFAANRTRTGSRIISSIAR